jgi:Zn-dependent peptidase ImmA (M78 family)
MAEVYCINKLKKVIKMTTIESYRDIEEMAERTLDQFQMKNIPVNPLAIANRLGAKVINAEFHEPDISGLIIKKGSEVTIYIKNSDDPVRKKFTLAHEIGHLVLHLQNLDGDFVDRYHMRRASNKRFTPEDSQKESEANGFAAALLMPKDRVFKFWSECDSIRSMAEIFEVSESAMGYRLINLGLTME